MIAGCESLTQSSAYPQVYQKTLRDFEAVVRQNAAEPLPENLKQLGKKERVVKLAEFNRSQIQRFEPLLVRLSRQEPESSYATAHGILVQLIHGLKQRKEAWTKALEAEDAQQIEAMNKDLAAFTQEKLTALEAQHKELKLETAALMSLRSFLKEQFSPTPVEPDAPQPMTAPNFEPATGN